MGQERWKAIHAMRDVDIILRLAEPGTSKSEIKLLHSEWGRRQDRVFEQVATLLNNRRSGQSLPFGTTDEKGRWFPEDFERQSCCEKIPMPSVTAPLRLFKHCCTDRHVAQFCGVDPVAFYRYQQRIKG